MSKRNCYLIIIHLILLFCFLGKSNAEGQQLVLSVYGKGAAGEWDNPILAKRNPNITWKGIDIGSVDGSSDLAQSLLTKSTYDIYGVGYSNNNFDDIMAKGFALDLSEYTDIVEAVDRMHPYIREAVKKDGKVYGVPIALSCNHWAYSTSAFEEISLSIDDVPTTYSELIDFIEWWIDEGAYENEDVQLFRGTQDIRYTVINRITRDLIDMYWYTNNAMSFSSPDLSMIFKKLDATDIREINENIGNMEEGDIYDHTVLFDVSKDWLDITVNDENAGFVPMPLSILKDDPFFIPVDMRLFFINPASQNNKAAALYLSTYLEGRDDVFSTIAYEGHHSPILNSYAESALSSAEHELSLIAASIAQAKDEDYRALDERKQSLLLTIDHLNSNRWLISQENIDAFSNIVPFLYIRKYSPLGSFDKQGDLAINSLIDQYAQKQISSSDFLSTLDRKISLILLEN